MSGYSLIKLSFILMRSSKSPSGETRLCNILKNVWSRSASWPETGGKESKQENRKTWRILIVLILANWSTEHQIRIEQNNKTDNKDKDIIFSIRILPRNIG